MISQTFSTLLVSSLIVLILLGCEKKAGLGDDVTPAAHSRIGIADYCSALSYSDSLFYYSEQAGSNIEKPQQYQSGTYGAFPAGLVINANTGAIDINKSESGLTYRVWFIPKGTKDSCSRLITVSGINYRSRLYNLATRDTLATPFYNGANDQECPCAKKPKGCEFNDSNDAAIAVVQGRKRLPAELEMDKETGTINLAKTIRNGLFGKKPANGSMIEFRLFYRLNDSSKKALNYIDLRIHYYDNVQAVPASLLARVKYKNTANFRIATLSGPLITSQNNSIYNGEDTGESFATRPPELVVTGG